MAALTLHLPESPITTTNLFSSNFCTSSDVKMSAILESATHSNVVNLLHSNSTSHQRTNYWPQIMSLWLFIATENTIWNYCKIPYDCFFISDCFFL